MKKMVGEFQYEIYERIEELEGAEKKLVEAAINTTSQAYAPYSGFKVGASVLLKNGTLVTGQNQENAVYPLGLCAERVALFSAGSQHPTETIVAMAITTEKQLEANEIPPFPCGSCRQSIVEFESRFKHPIKLFVTGTNGRIFVFDSVKTILPFAFNSDFL
jgi:cytidine deaminase